MAQSSWTPLEAAIMNIVSINLNGRIEKSDILINELKTWWEIVKFLDRNTIGFENESTVLVWVLVCSLPSQDELLALEVKSVWYLGYLVKWESIPLLLKFPIDFQACRQTSSIVLSYELMK